MDLSDGRTVERSGAYFYTVTFCGKDFAFPIHFGPDFADFSHGEPSNGAPATIGFGPYRYVIRQHGGPVGWLVPTEPAETL